MRRGTLRRCISHSHFPFAWRGGEMARKTAREKKLESEIEAKFKKDLDARLPGGWWIKGNSQMQQGIPDRMFLHGEHWAMLEFKRADNSDLQENQDWFIEKFDDMSFARFVSADNYQEVLDEIQEAFGG
jgi:hypothetical protein